MEILKTEELDGGGVREWILNKRQVNFGYDTQPDWCAVFEIFARDRAGAATTLYMPTVTAGTREIAMARWDESAQAPGRVDVVLEKRACGA